MKVHYGESNNANRTGCNNTFSEVKRQAGISDMCIEHTFFSCLSYTLLSVILPKLLQLDCLEKQPVNLLKTQLLTEPQVRAAKLISSARRTTQAILLYP